MCYDNFTAYLEDMNPILRALPPHLLATVQNCRVDSEGRPLLGDLKAEPTGWVRGEQTQLTGADDNDNNTRAVKLLRRLAEVDELPDAQYNLGCYYSEGKGVAPDHAQARKWFRRAALQGHVRAQVNLAIQLNTGVGGKENASDAFHWFSAAAQQGDARAQRMRGILLAQGRGVEQNATAAVGCYLRAARSNDTRSQFNLGVCYQEGLGVSKDLHKAAKWYWRAANLGDAQAMYNLACCYADGLGVQEDCNKASRWFAEAARRGYGPEVNDPVYGNVKALKSAPHAGAPSAPYAHAESAAGGAGAALRESGGGESGGPRGTDGNNLHRGVGAAAVGGGGGEREVTDEEKRAFPGLVGLVPPALPDLPDVRGVPQAILEKIEGAEAERRRRGMHGEGLVEEDELRGSISEEEADVLDPTREQALANADKAFQPAGLRGAAGGKPWVEREKDEELVGTDEGMVVPVVGLRVRLSRACLGQGVKGEDGTGTIQWVGNSKTVCHVKWYGSMVSGLEGLQV